METVLKIMGKVDPSVQKSMSKAINQLQSGNKQVKGMNKALVSTKTIIKGIIGSQLITSAVRGLKTMASAGLEYASDLEEVKAVVDTMFGANAKYVDEWAKRTQELYGINELTAKQFSSTFAALLKPAGFDETQIVNMSTALTGLAGDVAAFFNFEPEEVFDKLKSGLMGNTEPMEALGIDMRAASLEAYRLEKGIKTTYKKMSDGEQKLLRYNYIMERLADVQGMAESESGNYAMALKNLKQMAKDASGQLLKSLLPSITKFIRKAQTWIQKIDWEKWGDTLGDKVAELVVWFEKEAPKILPFFQNAGDEIRNFVNTVKRKSGEWKEFFANLDTTGLQNIAATVGNILGGVTDVDTSGVEGAVQGLITLVAKHGDKLLAIILAAKGLAVLKGLGDGVATVVGAFGGGKAAAGAAGAAGKAAGKAGETAAGAAGAGGAAAAGKAAKVGWATKLGTYFKGLPKTVKSAFTGSGGLGAVAYAPSQAEIDEITSKANNKAVTKAYENAIKKGKDTTDIEKLAEVLNSHKRDPMHVDTSGWADYKKTAEKTVANDIPKEAAKGSAKTGRELYNFRASQWDPAWNQMASGAQAAMDGVFASIGVQLGVLASDIRNQAASLQNGAFNVNAGSPVASGYSPRVPKYAKGGLTSGVSIAGEAGPEWVIPTDPRYRSRAQGLLARAADSLGMTPTNNTNSPSVSVSYAPNVTIQGGGDRAVISQMLRENAQELVAILEEALERKTGASFSGKISLAGILDGA